MSFSWIFLFLFGFFCCHFYNFFLFVFFCNVIGIFHLQLRVIVFALFYRIKIVVIHNGYGCIWNSSSSSHWHRIDDDCLQFVWKQKPKEKTTISKDSIFLSVIYLFSVFFLFLFLSHFEIDCQFICILIDLFDIIQNKPHSTKPHNSIEMT